MRSPARLLGVLAVAALVSFAGCEEDDDLVKGMDLKVVALRIPSQTSLTQGSSVTLTVLVKNNGTVLISKDFVTRIAFYENAALTVPSAWDSVEVSYPADVTYPEDDTGEIDSDVTVAFEVKTVVDASDPPQLVFCKVTCDTENLVTEADEGNNSLVEVCQVLPGTGWDPGDPGDPGPTIGPDPGISDINMPASVVRGNSLDVAITVRNYGDATIVGPATVAVTVNEGTSYEFGDSAARDISLVPDSTTSFEFSLPVDPEYATGTAQLVAKLLMPGDVNLDNNEDTTTFQITGPPQPDLVVASVTSSDTYQSDAVGGLSVSFTLKNEGNAEAYGSMAYVLICHETEGINDAKKEGETPVNALAPGEESVSYTVTCTYTAAAEGNYKVYVKADGLGTVAESNESNNAEKYDVTFIYF